MSATYLPEARPRQAAGRSRPALGRLVALAAGAVALIGFFLPWVRYQQASFSGAELASAIAPALAGVRSGGLKGFHIALHAVPALALVTVACTALSLRRRDQEDEARLSAWAGAAALAGLAIALLFVASALLPGTPGTQFSPGLVRTDAAVQAAAPRALNAGDLVGVGPGAYLTTVAFGAAAAGGGPTVLLVGDVALAHDVGGLLAAKRHELALTIVLLNNDGGGIFEFLPVSGEGDAYVEHVATPLGLDFTHAARLYGCEYVQACTLDAFRTTLDAAIASDHTTIVEVRSDRRANRELHRRVNEAVSPPTIPG